MLGLLLWGVLLFDLLLVEHYVSIKLSWFVCVRPVLPNVEVNAIVRVKVAGDLEGGGASGIVESLAGGLVGGVV